MMKIFTISTLGLALLATAACTNGNKLTVRKTLKAGRSGVTVVQDKALNDLLTGNSECLPLYALVNKLQGKDQAQTKTASVGTGTTSPLRGRAAAAAAAAQQKAAAKAGVDYAKLQFTIVINTRLLLDADDSASDPQLRFNTLIAPLDQVYETNYGSQILTGEFGRLLLNVSASSNCTAVTFKSADGKSQTFNVVKGTTTQTTSTVTANPLNPRQPQQLVQTTTGGTPARLTLTSPTTGEQREYKIVNNTLVIDVMKGVSGAVGCDKKPLEVSTRTRYTMSLGGNDSDFGISRSFATDLAATLAPEDVPSSLSAILDAIKNADDKSKSSIKGTRGEDLVVNQTDLEAINKAIQVAHFKPIECKK